MVPEELAVEHVELAVEDARGVVRSLKRLEFMARCPGSELDVCEVSDAPLDPSVGPHVPTSNAKGGVMKKISVRKAGAVRLTALCQCPYSAFNF